MTRALRLIAVFLSEIGCEPLAQRLLGPVSTHEIREVIDRAHRCMTLNRRYRLQADGFRAVAYEALGLSTKEEQL